MIALKHRWGIQSEPAVILYWKIDVGERNRTWAQKKESQGISPQICTRNPSHNMYNNYTIEPTWLSVQGTFGIMNHPASVSNVSSPPNRRREHPYCGFSYGLNKGHPGSYSDT
jgi:hypothetical protein